MRRIRSSQRLTNLRSALSDKFLRLQAQALRSSLWPKLRGQTLRLEVFPEKSPERSPNRRFLGEKEIPLAQVVGTLTRREDFDDQFRPLKPSLRDRWVNAYLALENEGWSPILVHKVGDRYYVEDGHHRASMARSLGMAFIQAKVWEYPVQAAPLTKYADRRCQERSAGCAGVTE